MNNVTRLSDAYNKSLDGNLYNLFKLAEFLDSDLKSDLNSILESRDMHTVTGKTLDYYGEMVDESRLGATDEQYRVRILQKIGRLTGTTNHYDVKFFISQMLNIDMQDFDLRDVRDLNTYENPRVEITGLTLDLIERTGYSSDEIAKMIEGLLTVGIPLAPLSFGGTLRLTEEKSSDEKYPILYPAWLNGQDGNCLSGVSDIPEEWGESGVTYEGGTLGFTE